MVKTRFKTSEDVKLSYHEMVYIPITYVCMEHMVWRLYGDDRSHGKNKMGKCKSEPSILSIFCHSKHRIVNPNNFLSQ